MKYKISNLKIMAFILMFFVTFAPITNSFANSETILTYDEAVKVALNNNRNLAKISDQIDNVDEQYSTPTGAPPYILSAKPSLSAQLTLRSQKLGNASQTVKLQFEAVSDGLELQLKGSFYKINLLKDSIDMKQKKLIDAQDKHRILSLKFRNGMASKYEIEQSEISLDEFKEGVKADKISLEKEFQNLKSIMGVTVFNYTEVEALPIEYSLVDDLHIKPEYQAAKAVGDSPMIMAQKKSIEEAELAIVLLPLEIVSAGSDAGITPINIQESQIKLKDTELRNAKDELYFSVVEAYNTIKSTENDITQLEVQLENLSSNISAMEVRLKAGVVSKRNLDDLLIMKEELLLGIKSLKVKHTMSLMQYQKPHLLGLS